MGRGGSGVATWNTIATAAKAILDGLASFPAVSIRKDGALHPNEISTTSQCVIAFGQESVQAGLLTFRDATGKPTDGHIYGLIFSLYLVNLGDIESNMSTFPDFVKAAKQALNTVTLSGASTVWNTELVENAAWEGVKFRDGVELSEFGINFYSAELRNG